MSLSHMEELEVKREKAEKYLPKIQKLMKPVKDKEFIGFMQEVLDHYMANVCQLGRRR